jgi:hypothetical protein
VSDIYINKYPIQYEFGKDPKYIPISTAFEVVAIDMSGFVLKIVDDSCVGFEFTSSFSAEMLSIGFSSLDVSQIVKLRNKPT